VAKAREREESEFFHHPCCADTPLATASEAAFKSTIQFMSLVDNELVQRARCRWAGFKIAFSKARESHPELPCRLLSPSGPYVWQNLMTAVILSPDDDISEANLGSAHAMAQFITEKQAAAREPEFEDIRR